MCATRLSIFFGHLLLNNKNVALPAKGSCVTLEKILYFLRKISILIAK